MKLLDRITKPLADRIEKKVRADIKKEQSANFTTNNAYNNIYTFSFDGEKNLGEIGPIRNYYLDYTALRTRSWQSYLESEITQTVLGKYLIWVIGSGLKLQAEPDKEVLASEGIKLDPEKFNKIVEPRFKTWRRSVESDYSNQLTFAECEEMAFKSAIIGGDVLVIQRVEKGVQNIQVIDGSKVGNPSDIKMVNNAKAIGNRIVDGVELDKRGRQVAYYVRQEGVYPTYERIEAYGKKTGKRMAFLVYGSKYRIGEVRGVPLIAVVLETLKKLERYKEATVGSAEERQKIVMQIVHELGSTNENPFNSTLQRALDVDGYSDQNDLAINAEGERIANLVNVSTNKQTVNMPNGAELKQVESKNELYFKDFYSVNVDLVCAAIGIPPEVALSKYGSNYSASRAAIKDWEHTLRVIRNRFSSQFHQPIYELFLHIQVLTNKIDAPQYLNAMASKNFYVISAYQNARFIGSSVPNIDPVKEVQAERLKLGESAKNIPLTTVEAATEALDSGDYAHNIRQYQEEYGMVEDDIKKSGQPTIQNPIEDTSDKSED